MIILVNFLILVKNITNYSKNDIDRGSTPLGIYELCSCIRETFCLSYSIRKNNTLYLYFQNEQTIIMFKGDKLRYLGPDERSQVLLLKRAINVSQKLTNLIEKDWVKSTPGILVRRVTDNTFFYNFWKSNFKGNCYLIVDKDQYSREEFDLSFLSNETLDHIDELLFIIASYPFSQNNTENVMFLRKLKNAKLVNLSKIKAIENKILYINFLIDQQIYT